MNGPFVFALEIFSNKINSSLRVVVGKNMLTHFIGNITSVEAGQIIVIVGKTTDAASR